MEGAEGLPTLERLCVGAATCCAGNLGDEEARNADGAVLCRLCLSAVAVV